MAMDVLALRLLNFPIYINYTAECVNNVPSINQLYIENIRNYWWLCVVYSFHFYLHFTFTGNRQWIVNRPVDRPHLCISVCVSGYVCVSKTDDFIRVSRCLLLVPDTDSSFCLPLGLMGN